MHEILLMFDNLEKKCDSDSSFEEKHKIGFLV